MPEFYDKILNSVRYRILEGIRADTVWRPSNFGNVTWVHYWANIFVDCEMCNQSIGMKMEDGTLEGGNVERISDDEALNVFRKHGWIIDLEASPKVILCPTCSKIPSEEMLG